jgi:SAM-dependent methyltransferase
MEETPEHWDEFWRSTSVIYPHETTIAAIERLGVESVLEVGAGSGRDLEELDSLGYRVGFSDISSEAVGGFARRNADSVALRVDARNLPLADNSFDLVMSLGVLEHFDRAERGDILREQFRVARRYVLVDVPQKWAPATFITKALNLVGAWPHGDESPFAYGDLVREVKEETKPKRVVSVYGRELVPLPRNIKGRLYSRLPSSVRRQYVQLQQHLAWGLAGCTGVVFEKSVAD